ISLSVIAPQLSWNGRRFQVQVSSVHFACATYSLSSNAILYVCSPTSHNASQTTQPTCSVGTTITGTIPAVNADLALRRDGVSYQASNVFTNVPANASYLITVRRISNGCVTNARTVTVAPTYGVPAAPALTTVQPTCAVSSGSITVDSP